MSILKYILFTLLLLGLWISEPLWRSSDTTTSSSPADEDKGEEKKAKNKEVNLEAKYYKELEPIFGPKPSGKPITGVPSSVYKYWQKTLRYPDSLQDETCGLIKGSNEGWTTVCRYRAKDSSGALELREEKFIIKNGRAYKK